MGYTEQAVGRMAYGKFAELFEVYKKIHNTQVKKMIYIDPEQPVSMMDV